MLTSLELEKIKNNKKDFDKFVIQNLGLVGSIANRYSHRGYEYEDILGI